MLKASERYKSSETRTRGEQLKAVEKNVLETPVRRKRARLAHDDASEVDRLRRVRVLCCDRRVARVERQPPVVKRVAAIAQNAAEVRGLRVDRMRTLDLGRRGTIPA